MTVINLDRDLRYVNTDFDNNPDTSGTGRTINAKPNIRVSNTINLSFGESKFHSGSWSLAANTSTGGGLLMDIPSTDRVVYRVSGIADSGQLGLKVGFGVGLRPAFVAGTYQSYDCDFWTPLTGLGDSKEIDAHVSMKAPSGSYADAPFMFYCLVVNPTSSAISSYFNWDFSVQKLNTLPPTLDTRMR